MNEGDTGGLQELKLHSTELFKGKFLHAFRDDVSLPSGALATREYVVHPGAVMVVPLLERPDGRIELVLERQYRYPVKKVMIEFPAGKLDPNETCFQCAVRELREETGFTAARWARAGVMHPVIAYSTEFIDIWFAKGLTLGPRQLDEGEFLDVFTLSPDDFFQHCLHGLITDGKTLAAGLWLQNVLTGAWPLVWQAAPSD